MGSNSLAVAIGGFTSGFTYTSLYGRFDAAGQAEYIWYVMAAHMALAPIRHANGRTRTVRWRSAVLLALPVAAALAVYANTLGAGFVHDDRSQILENPWVKSPIRLLDAISKPVWAFKHTVPTNYYRPVQMGLYNLLWAVSGGKPWAFHALQVALHAANVLLLGLLVRRLSGDAWLAGTAALLFAVHPLNTESVAWIACLPELTYAAFSLGALILHVSSWGAGPAGGRARRMLAVASFGLASFSKEPALVLVGVVFLLEASLGPPAAARGGARLWAAARATLPYIVAAAVYMAVRLAVVGGVAPLVRPGLTPGEAVVHAPILLLGYVRAILAPGRLVAHHVFDPLPSALAPAFWGGLLGVGLLVAVLAWAARRRRELVVAGALSMFPLLPVLYVPAIGDNVFAERYAYLPTAAGAWWLVTVALVLTGYLSDPQRARALVASLAVLLAVPASAATVRRNADWRDNLSFARTLVRDEPRAFLGHLVLGQEHLDRNELDLSIAAYEAGLRHVPGNPELEVNRLAVGLELGRIGSGEAIARLEPLARVHPGMPSIQHGLGFAYMQAERWDEAKAAFERALDLLPWSQRSLHALSVIAARRGDDRAAVEYSRRALEIAPEMASAHQQMGVSLLRLGEIERATAALERAVSLVPGDAGALTRLGTAYAYGGRLEEARRAFERALEIDPSHARARENLGRIGRAGSAPASPDARE